MGEETLSQVIIHDYRSNNQCFTKFLGWGSAGADRRTWGCVGALSNFREIQGMGDVGVPSIGVLVFKIIKIKIIMIKSQ
jgi:hypothetical protein